jgi:hypothetical protein
MQKCHRSVTFDQLVVLLYMGLLNTGFYYYNTPKNTVKFFYDDTIYQDDP